MAQLINPFPVSAYHGPEFFCNRNNEVKKLRDNIINGVNTTLISIRRMGKTGLIHHLFHKLSGKKEFHTLYADIYATQNQKELLDQLATSIVQSFPPKKTAGRKVLDFLTGLRPVISYDNLIGKPEVSFNFSQPRQQEQSLSAVLSFLDNLSINVVIALDEFQQISSYPEKNTEALLRTIIQPLKNVRFIFSGSSKHILTQMFQHKTRPFFGSTQIVELNTINQEEYEQFIKAHFAGHRRKISEEAVNFICSWTRLHTYYTQVVCNRLFGEGHSNISQALIQETCHMILEEHQGTFLQYRNLLTAAQWQMLAAIAKEDKLYQPNASAFISKHGLGTPSNVQRSLQALIAKEMIYQEDDEGGSYFRVYDCFLARWLERL